MHDSELFRLNTHFISFFVFVLFWSVLPDNKGWEEGHQVNVYMYVCFGSKNIRGLVSDIPKARKEI